MRGAEAARDFFGADTAREPEHRADAGRLGVRNNLGARLVQQTDPSSASRMTNGVGESPEGEDTVNADVATAGWKSEVFSFLYTLVIFLGIAFAIRVCLIEPFKIPSGSMIPTLRIGDHILVSKLSYGLRLPYVVDSAYMWDTPKRGDVVVFTRPDETTTPHEDESEINLIKRVVGLPGDTVETRDGRVKINGEPLDEPYARWDGLDTDPGDFGPEVIPDGKVFLLGDNRYHSRDGRYWEYHFLDIKRIKGRALFVYFSTDSFGRIGTWIH